MRQKLRGQRGEAELSEGDEIFEEFEAGVLAFLRVELGGEDVIFPDDGGEVGSVIGTGCDNGGIGRVD